MANREQEIGITETSDISFHLEAFDNLRRANIIITKRLTDGLINKLLIHKDKIILHLTVTGMGGTMVEPFVPPMETTKAKFDYLIESGFPVEQCVLRIDPIITTPKGIKTAISVLKLFRDSGITRIRWSSLDLYDHVKERFGEKGIPLPQPKFHAHIVKRNGLYSILEGICQVEGWILEACGEPDFEPTPCVSQRDLDILGIDDIKLVGKKGQRASCSCPSNKVELIQGKPERCGNSCLYCYWKD